MFEQSNTDAARMTSAKQKTFLGKIVETGFLIATWLALGLYLEIFGPTLIDLRLKLHTDYENVAVAVSGRSVGMFPGCIIGGFIVDKFDNYCHLMLALCLEVAAVVTFAVPWSPNAELLWFLCFVGGFVESVINIAGQRLILKLWLEKSATPMILLHSGYGIGSFLIPLYTNPFLAVKGDLRETGNITHLNESYAATTIAQDDIATQYIKDSKVEYAYTISATLVGLHSLSFYIFQLRERSFQENATVIGIHQIEVNTTDSKDEGKNCRKTLEMVNPAKCTNGRFWYGIQLFTLLVLYFANAGGGERVVAGFIRTFSVEQLKFSKDSASLLDTSFWISFTLGRLGFSIAARWISIRILILIQTGGLTVIVILMNIFAINNTLAYWILVQPLGIFIAPLWPSGVAWTDHHLKLTGVGMMLLLLGGSVGGIVHLRIIGYLYQHVSTRAFLFQCLGYGILAFILAIALDLVGAQHGDRFKWDMVKITEVNVVTSLTTLNDSSADDVQKNVA